MAIRFNEIYTPSNPIQPGYFGDFGCRFRYNKFNRQDYWWSGKVTENPFFDYVYYSNDVYEVPDTEVLLTDFYFRLDVNQVVHTRVVFNFMDFVGALGGVPGFLLEVGGYVIGGYSAFYASISTLSVLYRVR
jgi:hypothetical protein